MSSKSNQDTIVATTTQPSQLDYCNSLGNRIMPVIISLAISVILLLIISYLKYHMDKKSTYNDYWQFFLEIPIDLGNVAISVLIAYYFLVQDVTYIILAVLIELLAMIISISLRNTAVTMLDEDKINKRNVFFRISGEFFLVLIPALVSFFLILK